MSNVIPVDTGSLTFKWGANRYTLKLAGDCLLQTVEGAGETTNSKTPLHRIMPELVVDHSIPQRARSHGVNGRNAFIACVVVYFSDLHGHIPLLAPVLLLYALGNAWLAYLKLGPMHKTKIVSDWGEEIAVIPHFETEQMITQRTRFEEQLLAAVREARNLE